MTRVGFLIVATGRYAKHAAALIQSLRRHFRTADTTFEIFLFTDAESVPRGVRRLPIEHRPFPHAVLSRYEHYARYREALGHCTHLIALDADMKIASAVGEELIADRLATLHPGFFESALAAYPYERGTQSLACVARGEGVSYFCAGVQGGRTETFLALVDTIREATALDLAHGVIPVWHDESYLNRYLIDHPPTRVLSPAYCYPEFASLPFERKILAVEKDHRYARGLTSSPLREWMLAALRAGQSCARKTLRIARSFA